MVIELSLNRNFSKLSIVYSLKNQAQTFKRAIYIKEIANRSSGWRGLRTRGWMPGRFRGTKLHGGPWKPQQGFLCKDTFTKIVSSEGSLGNSTEPQEEMLMSLSVWSCGWVAISFLSVVWGARTPHGWIQIGHDHHLWVSTALSAMYFDLQERLLLYGLSFPV